MQIREVTNINEVFDDLKYLHRAHWRETEQYRRATFNPQYDLLLRYWASGMLAIWGVFDDAKMVGHLTYYLAPSMHTGELMATEDALYVLPSYRNGVGQKLVYTSLTELHARGVKEVWATTKPENRVGLMLKRVGFKHVADKWLLRTEDLNNVCTRPASAA